MISNNYENKQDFHHARVSSNIIHVPTVMCLCKFSGYHAD